MRKIFRLQRIWISEDLPTASEDFERLPKVAEDFPTTSDDFPKTSDDNRRCSKIFGDFKTGPATISKGFPTNIEHYLRVAKMFWRPLERQKTIEFLLNWFLSNYTRYCQLGMRN